METLILTALVVVGMLVLCIKNIVAAAKRKDKGQIVLNAVGVGIIFLLVLGTVLLVLFGGR